MITAEQAIERAAMNLEQEEEIHRRIYGGETSKLANELAKGWTELAKAIIQERMAPKVTDA